MLEMGIECESFEIDLCDIFGDFPLCTCFVLEPDGDFLISYQNERDDSIKLIIIMTLSQLFFIKS